MRIKQPSQWFVAVIGFLVLICSGCQITDYEHPTILPGVAEFPQELVGAYQYHPSEKQRKVTDEAGLSFMHIGHASSKHPRGFAKAVFVSARKDNEMSVEQYVTFADKIDDIWIWHVPLADRDVVKEQGLSGHFLDSWNPDRVQTYVLMGMRETNDGVEMLHIDDEFIQKSVKSGLLAGRVAAEVGDRSTAEDTDAENSSDAQGSLRPANRGVTVEASSKELRIFFEENLEDLFVTLDDDERVRFTRIIDPHKSN